MKPTKEEILRPHTAVVCGILLPLFVFTLALMQIIFLFGERGDEAATSTGGVILTVLSVLAYVIGELFLYPQSEKKSLFALSYFTTFALLAAISFHFITTGDFTYTFCQNGDTARTLLLSECFRLCAANAFALILRIGLEIARYIKALFR